MNPSWSDDQESHAINDSERARLAFAPFPSSPLAASQPLDLYQSYNTSSSRPDPVSQNLADGGPLAPPPVQTCNPKDLHVSIQSHVPRDQTEHDRAENEYRSQSTPQTPTQHLSTPWHDPETAIVKDNAKGNRRGQTRSSNYDNERAQRVKEVFACVFCQAVNVKCSDDPAVACPKCKTKERDCFRWKILSSIVAKWTVETWNLHFRTVANALPEPEDDGEMRLQFSIRSRDSEGCEVRLELRRGDDNPDYILESERNIYAFDRLARESVIGALNHSQRDDTPATRDLEQKAFTWAGYYVMLMGMQVAEYRVEIPDSWLVGQIKGLHSAEEHFGSQFPQAATQVSIQVLGFFGRRFTQLTKELLESSSTYVKDTKPAYKTRTALAIIYRVCLQHRFSAQQAIPGLRKLLSPITEMMESLSTELQKAGKAVYCMGIASGNISPSKTFDAFAIALMPSVKVPPLIVGYEYNSTREDLRLDARPKSLPPVDRNKTPESLLCVMPSSNATETYPPFDLFPNFFFDCDNDTDRTVDAELKRLSDDPDEASSIERDVDNGLTTGDQALPLSSFADTPWNHTYQGYPNNRGTEVARGNASQAYPTSYDSNNPGAMMPPPTRPIDTAIAQFPPIESASSRLPTLFDADRATRSSKRTWSITSASSISRESRHKKSHKGDQV